MKLVDMALDPAPSLYDAPAAPSIPYPYGLRINLGQEQLAALGYAELPPAGTQIHLEALGVVTRSSTEDPDADGDIDYLCVEIQLTQLGCEEAGKSAGTSDVDAGDGQGRPGGNKAQSDRAERMYAKGKQAA